MFPHKVSVQKDLVTVMFPMNELTFFPTTHLSGVLSTLQVVSRALLDVMVTARLLPADSCEHRLQGCRVTPLVIHWGLGGWGGGRFPTSGVFNNRILVGFFGRVPGSHEQWEKIRCWGKKNRPCISFVKQT